MENMEEEEEKYHKLLTKHVITCLYHINNNILIILTTVVFQDIFLHTISYTPTCYYHLRITTGLTHPLNNNTLTSINTIYTCTCT